MTHTHSTYRKKLRNEIMIHFPDDGSNLRVIKDERGKEKITSLSRDEKDVIARHTAMAVWYWGTGVALASITQELGRPKAFKEAQRNVRSLKAGLRLLSITNPEAYVAKIQQESLT